MPGTRKLGRPTDHRRSMLRGLVTYLLENGRIETTVTRAKEVRAMAEKMITIAKTDSLYSKRRVLAYVTKEDVVKKLFDEIAPKFSGINGGYTRIVKTGPRRGDAAEMCIIELAVPETAKPAAKKGRGSKAAKGAKDEKPAAKKAPAKAAKPAEEVKEDKAEATVEAVEEAAVEEVAETVEEAAVEEVVEAVEETAVEEVAEAVEEPAAEDAVEEEKPE